MQNHKKNIQQRFYAPGDVVNIPFIQMRFKKSILPGVDSNRKIYNEVKKPFRINLINNGIWYGEYL